MRLSKYQAVIATQELLSILSQHPQQQTVINGAHNSFTQRLSVTKKLARESLIEGQQEYRETQEKWKADDKNKGGPNESTHSE